MRVIGHPTSPGPGQRVLERGRAGSRGGRALRPELDKGPSIKFQPSVSRAILRRRALFAGEKGRYRREHAYAKARLAAGDARRRGRRSAIREASVRLSRRNPAIDDIAPKLLATPRAASNPPTGFASAGPTRLGQQSAGYSLAWNSWRRERGAPLTSRYAIDLSHRYLRGV